MNVESYLFFNGRCEEAIEFYRRSLGAELLAMIRYKDSPEPQPPGSIPPGWENNVMHALFRVGETKVMASDGDGHGATKFDGFALTLNVPDGAAAEKYFAALSDGGKVQMPLTKTFFSSHFGMLADKFGVMWMILVGKE